MNLNSIFSQNIKFQKHSSNNRYFYTYINDELLLLRMNDFPDEPLFTIILGLQIIDIDDAPENWEIPYD